jgi:hypothetical protein
MDAPALPVCRHRGEEAGAGAHRCHSPKLAGLKLVGAGQCQACGYRDHDPQPAPPAPAHLLPCAYLGPELGRRDGLAVHGCEHPGHRDTTAEQCRACPDYLFPLLTPRTPVPEVRRLLPLPPRAQPAGWWHWPNVQEAQRRAAADCRAAAGPYPGGHSGRGVVVPGGGKYFASAYVTVRVLRHVGCRLPIQLWHLAGEVDGPMREALRPYGVTCVDADEVAARRPFRFLHGHWWKGWQLKPYAIAHSPFREVLFLDADCYPTRDPEFLFDWPPYRERGAAFWPDWGGSDGLLPAGAGRVFGVELGRPPLESGQMLVDKGRCWAELRLALWYNAQADFVYRHLWGDKDTFNLAWRLAGRDYAMPWPRCGFDTHTLLQYGPDGAVLFQHRCQDKFRLEALPFDSTYQAFHANQRNPRLAHEDLCFRFLDELRQAWRPEPAGASRAPPGAPQ